jgi:hypothetical protein
VTYSEYPKQPPSKHFSWAEAEITNHRNLDNCIPIEIWPGVIYSALGMESIRTVLNALPITVSSWYRCLELNRIIGSKDTSQHVQGLAIDWICPGFGPPYRCVLACIEQREWIDFDQLILERGWIHTSFTIPSVKPRNQVLTLLSNGSYASGITDMNGKAL